MRPNMIADPYTPGPVPANPDPACQRTVADTNPGRAAAQTRTILTWFNPCAFTVPTVGTFGNFGRNVLRGKAVFNTDLSLFKSFPIREDMKLQFRVEAFNVFNIQNWEVPSALTINGANPGRITALAQGTTPRQIQFGLRFVF
jgi:hypothetical protein